MNRRLGKLAGAALLSLNLGGCAGFWDEVTSNNFEMKHLFENPDPFVVLQKSTDGNERAQALRVLVEPRGHGGTDQDQEAVLKILITAATRERQFLCRTAAIEALGKFKDPRAVDGLTEAFYSSGSFPPDMATRIQAQVVGALGQTQNPKAERFLIKLVQEKPKGEGPDQEKQQIMDVRLAAIRALGQFQEAAAVQALQTVLQSEKDVALRDCAQESMRLASGQKPPLIDFKPLENWFGPAQDAPNSGTFFNLVGWLFGPDPEPNPVAAATKEPAKPTR